MAHEITSLNAASLDIEELEARIEMSALMPTIICGGNCGSNNSCPKLASCGTFGVQKN